jgi:hypothetical protein
MNYELSNILFVFPNFIEISKNKIFISRCCYRQSCVLNHYATVTLIRWFVYNGPFVILTKNFIDIVYRLWVSAKCIVLLGILVVWFYFNGPWPIIQYYQAFYLYNLLPSVVHSVNGQHIGESDYWFSVAARLPRRFKSTFLANENSTCHENIRE